MHAACSMGKEFYTLLFFFLLWMQQHQAISCGICLQKIIFGLNRSMRNFSTVKHSLKRRIYNTGCLWAMFAISSERKVCYVLFQTSPEEFQFIFSTIFIPKQILFLNFLMHFYFLQDETIVHQIRSLALGHFNHKMLYYCISVEVNEEKQIQVHICLNSIL